MKSSVHLSLSTLLALAGALQATGANAQTVADSTGGSSQSHGELATTPAGIHPAHAGFVSARRFSGAGAVAADSTGQTSARAASFVLAHPRTVAAQASGGAKFQPYEDSTGGSSGALAAAELQQVASTSRTVVAGS